MGIFAVEPVSARPGVFDDGRIQSQPLDGVHVTFAPKSTLAADALSTCRCSCVDSTRYVRFS
jgi:hypothetical protein